MTLLLDTDVLLWALLEPQKLSPELRNALEDSDNTLVVSAVCAWEIATKWRLGKLPHARSVVENYAMALHRPAAQATADNLVLSSTDPAFAQFDGVLTLR
jgi:PIN domain nuclease of toxin-antitoxin system